MSGGEQWFFSKAVLLGGCCWWTVCATNTWRGGEHGECRGCKTKNEVEEDRPVGDADLSSMEK